MLRLMATIGVLLALMVSAQAQVRAISCSTPRSDDRNEIFKRLPREQAVRMPEVIVDGIIESYAPVGKPDALRLPGLVRIHVDKVWKGDVKPRVALLIPSLWRPEWPTQTEPVECPIPIRVGEQLRLGAEIAPNGILIANKLEVEADADILVEGGFPRYLLNMPLHDAELNRLLAAYQAKTDRLRQAAKTGGQQAKLALAAHLLANNEEQRAFEIYDALVRDNPSDLDLLLTLAVARTQAHRPDEPEATLAIVRERAPQTEKWRSKIARARLAATGLLTAEGKDWSDLKRMHKTCYSDHAVFDGTLFDRADLSDCAFRYSSFRDVSFRGTNLTNTYFQNADLAGAQYDCATRLPDDLDPAAAGMINVAGSCNK